MNKLVKPMVDRSVVIQRARKMVTVIILPVFPYLDHSTRKRRSMMRTPMVNRRRSKKFH